MATYMFTIRGRLPGLNDLIDADRRDKRAGNRLKSTTQGMIRMYIYHDLQRLKIEQPVKIHYMFYEPNRKRDLDNISGFAHKVIQDSLVAAGVLKNDGWSNIIGFSDEFRVDAKTPRIEVVIEEVW